MENSVWANHSALPHFPALKGERKTDVLIVGGGMAGILCAWKLKQAGVDCILIEADKICQGVTRNTTAKITSQHGFVYAKLLRSFGEETARAYWEANERALAQYRVLSRTINCDFEDKDSYIYCRSSQAELEKEMRALEQLQIPAQFVSNVKLPMIVAGAIRFRDQGQFNPLKFSSEIVKGLPIYEHTEAREFEKNVVTTNGGRITAEKIIVATHFPILNKHGGYFLKQYQERSYVIALENAMDVDGVYLDGEKGDFSFRNHGNLLLLGGGTHRTGKQGRGWTDLEVFAKAHFPNARQVCRWATQDCMTLDGIPYIGQYSKGTPNLYVTTGFNKWGMTSSMVAADILCDLVQGRENTFAPVFSPQRTSLRAQLGLNVLESTVNLLTPTKPRCPHLGCALKWNPQEHSWDCPCHGSRFGEAGTLLDGPATGNLKPKK